MDVCFGLNPVRWLHLIVFHFSSPGPVEDTLFSGRI